MLAIIGGSPVRFIPFSRLFQQALDIICRPPLPLGVHSPGHVAETDEKARENFWPRHLQVIPHDAETRGFAIPTKESFTHELLMRNIELYGSQVIPRMRALLAQRASSND
jgi:hypothetical protein